MTLIQFLKDSTQWLTWIGIGFAFLTLISFIFRFGIKYRLLGTTIFTFLLSGSCLAFSISYEPSVLVEGAKYAPIVYDNGYDLVVAQASEDFPPESIDATLNQIAANLKGGGRNGAMVHVRLRKIEDFEEGISQPTILGEVIRDIRQNSTISLKQITNEK